MYGDFSEEGAMERMLERVAGLDVHKRTVAVCISVPGDHGERHQHVRTEPPRFSRRLNYVSVTNSAGAGW